MKTLTAAASACALGVLALPAAAGATASVTELGQFDSSVKGSCPGKPCYAFSRTTGYQAKVGDKKNPMAAPADGRIVAFTVSFGNPGKKQISYFEKKLGGAASISLAIINPPKKLRARTVASSPAFDPSPYFNSVATFALEKSIPIKKGQIVGLTSTSWAPLMQTGQPVTTSWRASRNKGTCDDVQVQQTAQTQPNQLARYYCLYKSIRLAYSATFIPDPKTKDSSTRAYMRRAGE